MKNESLLKKVSALGYSLFEKEDGADVDLTFAEVVKSRDLRLWEGFPLMLANAVKAGSFDYKKARAHLKKQAIRHIFSMGRLFQEKGAFDSLRRNSYDTFGC